MKFKISEFFIRTITSIVLITGLFLFLFLFPPIYFSILLCCAAAYMYLVEWQHMKIKCPIHWAVTGIIYPLLPSILLIYLNQQPRYHPLIVLIFTLTPLFDITSYCAGKAWGRNRIAPAVSPGKTWQGFVGGVGAVLIIVNAYAHFYNFSVGSQFLSNLFGILFSTTALFGDLFESWVKRKAHLKDSGDLLPGHGGLLDRMDALLAIAVLVFFLRDYLILFF